MNEATNNAERKYIGIHEIADMLGICYASVRDNIVPNVEHITVGRRILVDAESFHKYLKKQRKKMAEA